MKQDQEKAMVPTKTVLTQMTRFPSAVNSFEHIPWDGVMNPSDQPPSSSLAWMEIWQLIVGHGVVPLATMNHPSARSPQ